jgi:hypothetical protein
MSIAPGQAGSTSFKVAAATELGASTLYVVTNGIPSVGRFVTVDNSCAANARGHDFNGDGMSDIVWRDGSGNTALWLMGGAAISSAGVYGGLSSTWSIVGQRDFNGDGTADLLWRDDTGYSYIWFMNGTQITSTGYVGLIPASTWTVAAVSDFNGDGIGDILWRDNSSNYAVWLMSGANIMTAAGLGNVSGWSVVGTGDFNGDGKSDILWRDASGNTAMWFMNGVTVASGSGVTNPGGTWAWPEQGTSTPTARATSCGATIRATPRCG